MEICARIGRVPGTRDRGSNETKQTRHLLAEFGGRCHNQGAAAARRRDQSGILAAHGETRLT